MTKYLTYKIKALLKNPELIGWAILFVEFWVFMWFYVFGSDILNYKGQSYYEDVVRGYISVAYSSLSTITLGSVAIALTQGLFASSMSVRYVTRFGRITPRRFFIEDFFSSLAVLLVCVLVIISSAIVIGYLRYEVLVIPDNIIGLFFALLAFGAFFYLISINLSYLAILLRRPRLTSLFGMIPLILAFIFYGSIFTSLNEIFPYVYPINALASLVVLFSLGETPPGSGYISWLSNYTTQGGDVNTIDLRIALVSIILWMLLLTTTAIVMIRKSRGVSIEELRIS